MKEEIKKLLHQKLLVFIFVLLCLLSAYFSINHRAIYRFTGKDSEVHYQSYIKEFEGYITDDKVQKLELIEKEMAEAEHQRNAALDQVAHENDSLNVQQIKQQLVNSYSLLDRKEAFTSMKEQVNYVMEDPNARELIDPLGWKYLLQDDQLDYMLILALLAMNISLFTIEYDTDMQLLSITMRKGKLLQYQNKIKTGMLLSTILIILLLGIRDISYATSYSLTNATASLQSVPTFTSAPFQLSLGSTYMLSRVIQLGGYLCLSAWIWATTVFFKKFFSTFVMIISIVFILNQLIPAPYIYMLPTPVAMMQGSGFFRGNEVLWLNKGSSSEYAIQSYMAGNKIVAFVMLVITCCLVLLLVRSAYHKYCNILHKRSHIKKGIIGILVVAVLGGCGQKNIESTENTNLIQIATPINGGFLMVLNNDIVLVKDGVTTSYIHSTDYRKENRHSNITLSGNAICYLNWPSNSNQQGFTLECYDSKTRDTSILYDAKKTFVKDSLFGLVKEYEIELEDSAQLDLINSYFFHDEFIYFIDAQQHLIQQDVNSNQKQVLLNDCWNDPILINGVLYYINKELDLCAYDLSTQSKTVIDRDLVTNVTCCQQQLYFTKANEEGVFCYNAQGVKKLFSGYDTLLSVNSKYIYVQQNQSTYYYNIATSQITTIALDDIVDLQAMENTLLVGRMIDGTYQLFQYDLELQQGIQVS